MVLVPKLNRNTHLIYLQECEINNQNASDTVIYLETIFDLCLSCYSENKAMAFAPPSAFCAKKVRENEEKLTLARNLHGENFNFQKHFNNKLMELTPLKYNSKLMNSIWGLYNRYSPHNIKRTNDDEISHSNSGGLTESSNLPKAGVSKEAASAQLGKGTNKNQGQNISQIWSNIPISQSN